MELTCESGYSASHEINFDDVAFYIAKGPGIGTSVDGISIPGLALFCHHETKTDETRRMRYSRASAETHSSQDI